MGGINLLFSIIGTDSRMDYVAEKLYSLGCEVSRSLSDNQNDTILVISPPVNIDYIDKIYPSICNIKRIYGGSISNLFYEAMSKIEIYDYLKWENVISKNAVLTAKGIIKEALEYNCSLNNSNILITGYGYCSKAIASELSKYSDNINIAVRNSKLKSEITNNNYVYVDINNLSNNDLWSYEYIFNTVPALVIDKPVIDSLNKNVMIFDIASKPGGVDFEYCSVNNIFSKLSLGIPGRIYPKEAGYLIAEAVYNHYMQTQ